MPIKSFADIDNMIANYNNSNTPQTHHTYGCWSPSFSQNSSSSTSSISSNMSRNTRRIIGVRDILDENGYFNSSRQILK